MEKRRGSNGERMEGESKGERSEKCETIGELPADKEELLTGGRASMAQLDRRKTARTKGAEIAVSQENCMCSKNGKGSANLQLLHSVSRQAPASSSS